MTYQVAEVFKWFCCVFWGDIWEDKVQLKRIFILDWSPFNDFSQVILIKRHFWLTVVRQYDIFIHNWIEFLKNPLFKLFDRMLASDDQIHDI